MTLFVLARNAATYNAQYKATVTENLNALGFTGYKVRRLFSLAYTQRLNVHTYIHAHVHM